MTEKGEIIFEDFNGYWKIEDNATSLSNICLKIKPGSLVGVTGKVGSGKSVLLGAILD